MTTTYGITLPPVIGAHIAYAGCGSHQLEITAHVEGEFDLDDFIQELVKVARDNCHHRPTDVTVSPRVCRFCDAEIRMNGPDSEGQQSWALSKEA